MTEHNINESTINENLEDKKASDEAAEEAHVPTEDIESAPEGDRVSPEKLAEAARKVATETAYAAAGFAGLVGEKAKAFYDEQKKQYADAHPDEDAPKAKAFLDQLSEQLNRFAEDLSRGYREMAERGRDVVQRNSQARRPHDDGQGATNDGETPVAGNAPTFSSDLSDDVVEGRAGKGEGHVADASADSTINDGESDVPADAPAFSSDLSEDVSEERSKDEDVLGGPEKQDGIL